MDENPIDLTPLDPDADPAAEERFVGGVMSRIGERPKLYPVPVDALWGAWSLARPVLVAASIAIAIAGFYMARAMRTEPLTVAESLGVPPAFQAVMAMPVAQPGGAPR